MPRKPKHTVEKEAQDKARAESADDVRHLMVWAADWRHGWLEIVEEFPELVRRAGEPIAHGGPPSLVISAPVFGPQGHATVEEALHALPTERLVRFAKRLHDHGDRFATRVPLPPEVASDPAMCERFATESSQPERDAIDHAVARLKEPERDKPRGLRAMHETGGVVRQTPLGRTIVDEGGTYLGNLVRYAFDANTPQAVADLLARLTKPTPGGPKGDARVGSFVRALVEMAKGCWKTKDGKATCNAAAASRWLAQTWGIDYSERSVRESVKAGWTPADGAMAGRIVEWFLKYWGGHDPAKMEANTRQAMTTFAMVPGGKAAPLFKAAIARRKKTPRA